MGVLCMLGAPHRSQLQANFTQSTELISVISGTWQHSLELKPGLALPLVKWSIFPRCLDCIALEMAHYQEPLSHFLQAGRSTCKGHQSPYNTSIFFLEKELLSASRLKMCGSDPFKVGQMIYFSLFGYGHQFRPTGPFHIVAVYYRNTWCFILCHF